MSIEAEIIKDDKGFPTLVKLKHRNNRLEAYFQDRKLTLKGNSRSLRDETLNNALKLIYPNQEKTVLTIPEPLATTVISGGQTLFFDDFEGLLKWYSTDGAAIDNTNAYNGSNCLKITCQAAWLQGDTLREFTAFANKLSLECFFMIHDWTKTESVFFGLLQQTENLLLHGEIKITSSAISYYNTAGAYTTINSLATLRQRDGVYGPWHRIKFTVDLANQKYGKVEIGEKTYSLTAPIHSGGAVAGLQTYAFIGIDNVAGQEAILYLDDVLIRKEE